jgi:hypothetical protein
MRIHKDQRHPNGNILGVLFLGVNLVGQMLIIAHDQHGQL